MATQAILKAKYPQTIQMSHADAQVVDETTRLGQYRFKSDMFRDAVRLLNTKLKEEL